MVNKISNAVEKHRQLILDAERMIDPELDLPVDVPWSKGSTDMGDLGHIMPVVHPYAAGAIGSGHGNNYYITDPVAACVTNAKWQIMMLYLLLENGGERAKKVLAEYKPVFASAKEFLDYQDSLNDSGDRIIYKDGEAAVRI